ncbi:glycoside hydrolase family 79 protein [Trametes sanguinea]|nr:glycoside hydrolase family 79 protein [Trametes sanguinea]
MLKPSLVLLGLANIWTHVLASVTIYGQQGITMPSAIASTDGAAATAASTDQSWISSLAAYNNVTLTPPPLPDPVPSLQFGIQLLNNAQNVGGLSIPQKGSFMGFSIEMSVVEQVSECFLSFIQVPFLNLLATLASRAGIVTIRVGGNTQETATLVPSLPNNAMIAKDKQDASNPTETPVLDFTAEMLYLLGNVSALVNARWYLGIPFNDTSNLRLQIAEAAETILGDKVLAFQVGNEPDLYADHGHRSPGYNQTDYFNDFGIVVNAIQNDAQIPTRGNLVAPSLQGAWSLESVLDTGFLTSYGDDVSILSVERYPEQNCAAAFPGGDFGPVINPQDVFPIYLNHSSGQGIVSAYLDGAQVAIGAGKEFMMFETNTASCGGFPGVSDSFGAALWGVDYGLQMAYSNFTGALLHVGGQDVSYNPFTPPPTNLSSVKEWTIGPIFYSTLVIAEALGTTNTSRVLDLQANGANAYTPAYAIYENDALARVVLINFMTEQNGQGAYTATISVGGGQTGEPNETPSQVKVKYLLAPSVSEKNNVTWANQTFGGRFEADGRLSGTEVIQTIQCDTNANTCDIPVPAPGVALVFVSSDAQNAADPSETQTYATTAVTKTANTVTIDPSVLATSNGQSGADRQLSSTSKGSSSAGRTAGVAPGLTVLAMVIAGVSVIVAAGRR